MSAPTLKGELRRHVRIALRTLHIAAAVIVLGGAHFGGHSHPWSALLLLSGLGIIADDLDRNGLAWFRYVQGWVVIGKTALVIVGLAWPTVLLPCLWGSLILGSFVSHTAGWIRHYALWGPPRDRPPAANHPGAGRG